ncbi:MAG: hypothetical protein ACTHJL_14460 [Amnibacterium sp.]
MMPRRLLPAVLLCVLALTGCTTAAPTPPPGSSPVTTVPPTTAPPPAPAPSPTDTAPTTQPAAEGCAANTTPLPAGAQPALDGDLDGDGKDDRIFAAPSTNRFGIVTASGAVLLVHDPLAGPGRHTAWATRIAGGAVVLTIADGRGALLFSLQHAGGTCTIAPVANPQGDQYAFDQEELRGHGTGVGCRPQDGALQLGGYDAHAVGADRFRVTFTRVTVSPDGRTARNGATTLVAASAARDSATVRIARDSTCASVPIVGTSGE